MIGIYDIMTWLRSTQAYQTHFESSYCGKLDSSREKTLGVYPLRQSGKPYRAYQGLESYQKAAVSLLIHYNRNVDESQRAADSIFQFLCTPNPYANVPLVCDAYRVHNIELTTQESVFVGTDESGIFEFVIEFVLYVEKENEKHG